MLSELLSSYKQVPMTNHEFCSCVCVRFSIKQSMVAHDEEERGKTCSNCGDLCPGFSAHYWR